MTKTADNIYFYVNNFLFNTVFAASCRDESWILYTEEKNQTKKETDKERLSLYEISDKRLQHPLEGRQRTQQYKPDEVSCFTF